MRNDIYYNTDKSSGFVDWQYDMLKETLENRDPDYVVPVGAKIRKGENRVKLPYWLGSMDKMKMEPQFHDISLSEMREILSDEKNKKVHVKDDELRNVKSRIKKIQHHISQLQFLDKWLIINKAPYLIRR